MPSKINMVRINQNFALGIIEANYYYYYALVPAYAIKNQNEEEKSN